MVCSVIDTVIEEDMTSKGAGVEGRKARGERGNLGSNGTSSVYVPDGVRRCARSRVIPAWEPSERHDNTR